MSSPSTKTSTLSSFSKLSTSQNNPLAPPPPPFLSPLPNFNPSYHYLLLYQVFSASYQYLTLLQIYYPIYLNFPLFHHFITTHCYLFLQIANPTLPLCLPPPPSLPPNLPSPPLHPTLQSSLQLPLPTLQSNPFCPIPPSCQTLPILCSSASQYTFILLSVEFTSYHVKCSSFSDQFQI